MFIYETQLFDKNGQMQKKAIAFFIRHQYGTSPAKRIAGAG